MNNTNEKVNVGIVGATGYVGAELIRLLLNHPQVNIAAISSVSFENTPISKVYPAFAAIMDDKCTSQEQVVAKSDVVFAALPHGLSQPLAKQCWDSGKYFIDMGADFRLESEEQYKEWYGCSFDDKALHGAAIYGMPELFRSNIKKGSRIIANPGCYATATPLSLAPALADGIVDGDNIIVDAKSGVTGAGRGLSDTTHFATLNEGFHPYKAAAHRHTPEIEQTLSKVAGKEVKITFVPHLLPINRGIIATCYAKLNRDISIEDVHNIYSEHYKDEKFIRLLPIGQCANLKNVKYSNYCDISLHIDKHTNTLICVGAIDNMVKGAAGQAIQNMNLVLGFDEACGLDIVPPCF